jgi:putative ABC transport system ATP-binding protein
LCDEPTGAVDLETSRHLLGMLLDLNRKLRKTVVLVTHNNAIAGIGDRVAHIRDGGVYSIEINKEPTPVEQVSW